MQTRLRESLDWQPQLQQTTSIAFIHLQFSVIILNLLLQAENKKKGALSRNVSRLLTPTSLALIVAWLVLFGLFYYVQQFAKELAPFDPFDILKVCFLHYHLSPLSLEVSILLKAASG